MTPGNFFALKTWNSSENVDARIGAEAVLRVGVVPGMPQLTKFIFRLEESY